MVQQQEGSFENFMDLQQCTTVMQRKAYEHNSSTLPPVHELFKRPLYNNVVSTAKTI